MGYEPNAGSLHKQNSRQSKCVARGIEPESIAWKATMLTITPATLTWQQLEFLDSLRQSNKTHEKRKALNKFTLPTPTHKLASTSMSCTALTHNSLHTISQFRLTPTQSTPPQTSPTLPQHRLTLLGVYATSAQLTFKKIYTYLNIGLHLSPKTHLIDAINLARR